MYILIAALLSLTFSSTLCDDTKTSPSMRDLIILLDDHVETNMDRAGSVTDYVCNALMSEAAPLLITASLWQTFVEMRQEWLLLSQIPDTREYKMARCLDEIDTSINHWYNLLQGTCDELQIRAIIADKINEQFFTEEQSEEREIPGKKTDLAILFARFAAHYDCSAYYWFYLDAGYYLVIPKTYVRHYTNSTEYRAILTASGFSSELQFVTNPLDLDPIKVMQLPTTETTIIPTLEKLFLPAKEHLWTLFIAGHGQSYKTDYSTNRLIAGVTTQKFKEICTHLNRQLSVHLLWISSCFAGGVNRFEITDIPYHYAMVIESLGDVPHYNTLDLPTISSESLFHCMRDFIIKTADNKWTLWYRYSRRFIDFFEKIHTIYENEGNKAIQDSVYDAFSKISPRRYIENTPYILPTNSNNWLLCRPSYDIYLNTQSALLAELHNMPHLLHAHTIFIDTPILNAGFKLIPGDLKFIAFITPGDSTHYIGPVDASEIKINKFIRYFWPSFEPIYDKQILFESITCECDPNDPLVQILGITEETVTFSNVFMHIVKHEKMELTFTTPNGDVYYATVRSVDGNGPSVRNLQKLSATAAESYRSYYNATKHELISRTDEAYASLRNQYVCRMHKGDNQDPKATISA